MPPPGFKNISLPDVTIDQIRHARRMLVERGLHALPSDVIPPECINVQTVSNGMVIAIAFRCLEKAIEEKKMKRRSP